MEYRTKDTKSMFYVFDPMADPQTIDRKEVLKFFIYEGPI